MLTSMQSNQALSSDELVELKLSCGVALQYDSRESLQSLVGINLMDLNVYRTWEDDYRIKYLANRGGLVEHYKRQIADWAFRVGQVKFANTQASLDGRLVHLVGITSEILFDSGNQELKEFVIWCFDRMNALLYLEHCS